MLPIYRAISFDSIIEKGARTKPWIVLVLANGQLKPYVVKLFETAAIEAKDCVANEVIGNILAKEFELRVPECALVEFDENFRSTIQDPQVLEILDLRDDRLKFGTELLQGFNQMNTSAFTATQVRKMIDIGMLFAFDNLIRNRDRNRGIKPNLLVKSNTAVVIDHELGFELTCDTQNELQTMQWDSSFYRFHIFYDYLKRSKSLSKLSYFSEFAEYLKYLNLNKLVPYFSQLRNCGYSDKKHQIVMDYLAYMKGKYRNFENLLKGIIQ